MTIRITVECDAAHCARSHEFYDEPSEGDLERAGWHLHPEYEGTHYCQKCWPAVKKEIEETEGEAI